jgi:hypothetical protein
MDWKTGKMKAWGRNESFMGEGIIYFIEINRERTS